VDRAGREALAREPVADEADRALELRGLGVATDAAALALEQARDGG
jgi:hypothetical protein